MRIEWPCDAKYYFKFKMEKLLKGNIKSDTSTSTSNIRIPETDTSSFIVITNSFLFIYVLNFIQL